LSEGVVSSPHLFSPLLSFLLFSSPVLSSNLLSSLLLSSPVLFPFLLSSYRFSSLLLSSPLLSSPCERYRKREYNALEILSAKTRYKTEH
jgi:hypothetical protein